MRSFPSPLWIEIPTESRRSKWHEDPRPRRGGNVGAQDVPDIAGTLPGHRLHGFPIPLRTVLSAG